MRCDETRELLSPYLDGELTPPQRMAVDAHLARCADCASELSDYQSLSDFAARMVDPLPPADLWERIDGARPAPRNSSGPPPTRRRRRLWQVAAAVVLLIAAAVTLTMIPQGGAAGHKTVNLDSYLTRFAADPDGAQNALIASYENREVGVREASAELNYQPAAAGGLPDGVSVRSMHLFKMPCCRCLQTVCTVEGKQTVVLFEHADEHSFRFGRRPSMTCPCKGKATRIVQYDGRLVASWARGRRHLTLIGARDLSQVVQFVERVQ